MYQALYRKYRSIDFDDVVGQDVITTTLKNAIASAKTTHAYLFTGPRGTGKTSIAKIFAKTINCTNLSDSKPCNECVSCTQIDGKQATDIIEIDAASNNGVEEIRELKSKINLVPANSKYKVYIIDEVHMLTVGAFNALLKTLEEPPKHIVFILATTEPHKIPMTILSRCQRFDFKKISENKIFERLKYICEKEGISIADDAVMEISRISDGGMRDAISMLDQVIAYSPDVVSLEDVHEVNGTLNKDDLKKFINSVLENDLYVCFSEIENYYDKGKNFVKLAEEIVMFLRNCLIYMTVPDYLKEIDTYIDISKKTSNKKILFMIEQFNSLIFEMKETNNPKLIFELAMIRLMSFEVSENSLENFTEKLPLSKDINEINTLKKDNIDDSSKVLVTSDKKVGLSQVKDLSKEKNDDKMWGRFEKIKGIRVNNALVNPTRECLENAKHDIDKIRSLTLEIDYSQLPSLVLDGSIKAVTDNYVIFAYELESGAKSFNKNILAIENMLEKVIGRKYTLIALSNSEWNVFKSNYRNRKGNYEHINEDIGIENIFKELNVENNNDIKSLFGDLVEMK